MTSIRPQIDLSRVVKRFAATSDIAIESAQGGQWSNGRWDSTGGTAVNVTANVQPASGKDRQVLEDGLRTKEAIVVHCTSEILPVQRTTSQPGDVIIWQGQRYECVNVQDWNTNGRYWRALAVKVDQ